jgi:hypothetical protein
MNIKKYQEMAETTIYEQLGALKLLNNPKFNKNSSIAGLMNNDILQIIHNKLDYMYYKSRFEVLGIVKMYSLFIHFKLNTEFYENAIQYFHKIELRAIIKPILRYHLDIIKTELIKSNLTEQANNSHTFYINIMNKGTSIIIDLFKINLDEYDDETLYSIAMNIPIPPKHNYFSTKKVYIKYNKIYELFYQEYENNKYFKEYVDIFNDKINNILLFITPCEYNILVLSDKYLKYTTILNEINELITFPHNIYINFT